jgi:hypothetical protein
MRDNSGMAEAQAEQRTKPRRGRPRKWPSEAARREHEAAKRRLRSKTHLTSEAFHDAVRLTALADDLQQRLDGALKELDELKWHAHELERRLAEASKLRQPNREPTTPRPASAPPRTMNRRQRREAERVQRRSNRQERLSEPPP